MSKDFHFSCTRRLGIDHYRRSKLQARRTRRLPYGTSFLLFEAAIQFLIINRSVNSRLHSSTYFTVIAARTRSAFRFLLQFTSYWITTNVHFIAFFKRPAIAIFALFNDRVSTIPANFKLIERKDERMKIVYFISQVFLEWILTSFGLFSKQRPWPIRSASM